MVGLQVDSCIVVLMQNLNKSCPTRPIPWAMLLQSTVARRFPHRIGLRHSEEESLLRDCSVCYR